MHLRRSVKRCRTASCIIDNHENLLQQFGAPALTRGYVKKDLRILMQSQERVQVPRDRRMLPRALSMNTQLGIREAHSSEPALLPALGAEEKDGDRRWKRPLVHPLCSKQVSGSTTTIRIQRPCGSVSIRRRYLQRA